MRIIQHPMSIAPAQTATTPPLDCSALLARYHAVRRTTERLCRPLGAEDHVVQAMPDVSPTKWHLAHVVLVLRDVPAGAAACPATRRSNPAYRVLFNSYYNGIGPQFSRPDRGHLSRPTVAEVAAYRARVDRAMAALLERGDEARAGRARAAARARPAPRAAASGADPDRHQVQPRRQSAATRPITRVTLRPRRRRHRPSAGASTRAACSPIGHDGVGFAFDNEWPRHTRLSATVPRSATGR